MRGVLFREFGGPEVLRSAELPEPALRERDILVKVRASSVNPVDTKVRSRNSAMRKFPIVLGYDVSGVVVRGGPRAKLWQPGDEVFAAPNRFRQGANAGYVALDERSGARKPNQSITNTPQPCRSYV